MNVGTLCVCVFSLEEPESATIFVGLKSVLIKMGFAPNINKTYSVRKCRVRACTEESPITRVFTPQASAVETQSQGPV